MGRDDRPTIVAFQGEAGAYSEGAAFAALGEGIDTLACSSFDRVFEALADGRADRAVLPIENSLAGSIHRNYDLLLRHEAVHITGELAFRVRHHLLALPGTRLDEVTEVISHPQALSQCERYLDGLGVIRRATYDTAGSAKAVREGELTGTAAIASRRAADVYDLEVLAEGIEDDPENYTRFLVVATEPTAPPPGDGHGAKTSIVFALRDEPSVLFKALSVFALRDIDLTKIESRPLPPGHTIDGQRWTYLFYLDFAESTAADRAQNALRHLGEIATYLRVLGSYPRND